MSKTLKILLTILAITLLVVFFSISKVTATDDENNSTDTNTSFENSIQEANDALSTTSSNSNFSNSGVTSVTQVSNYSEANLGINNVLSVILIAIGVLIILLAIAILIRLGH